MRRYLSFHTFKLITLTFILGLAACGGGSTGEEPATQPPAGQGEQVVEVPTEEPPAPPDVTVSLPAEAINRLASVAESNGYDWQDLASDHTVFYAFPDTGIAFLLTPIAGGPGKTAEVLAQEPGNIQNLMLGGLTVISGFSGFPLSQGDYLITLAPDGEELQFTQLNGDVFSFPAVIRSLPQPLSRELALITSSQMCLAWNRTQVCALVNAPLRSDLVQQINNAIENLGIDPASIALERAIPDVEGFNMIQRCADALANEPPSYDQCRSTVLAAPAVADGAFDATSQAEGTYTGIALLVVLEPLKDQVFLDPQLTQVAEGLPNGDYLTFEVLLSGETPTRDEPIPTRVAQEGPQGSFYLPAQSGGALIGDPVRGFGPSNEDEAVIANLWCKGRCYFKWWQCP